MAKKYDREVEEVLRGTKGNPWPDRAVYELYKRPNMLDEVKAFLAHPDPSIRSRAAYVTARFNKGQHLPALSALFNDPSEDVRMMMCDLHMRYGNESSFETLARLLQEDPDPDVRVGAAHALQNIGDGSVISILERALTDEEEDMQGYEVRHVAQQAIEAIRRRLGG